FFVISGFVVSRSLDQFPITSLKAYQVHFYSKRLKRLFPALLVSVAFLLVLSLIFMGGLGKITIRTGAASLFGLSNLYLIRSGNNHFGLGSQFNLFLPPWSLGIEEQFYFFLPVFLFWLKVKKRPILRCFL